MNRYIVSLKENAEEPPARMAETLLEIVPDVKIVEGLGLFALTVDMSPEDFEYARDHMTFCDFEPDGYLHPLQARG